MKTVKEFKRENRDGRYCYVKRLAFGGEVQKNSPTDFTAYDANGHYVGFTGDQAAAEALATSGFVNTPYVDQAPELSLWTLWEDARHSGARIMQSEDGVQVMCLGFGVFMAVKQNQGWDVELLSDQELADRWYDEDEQCFRLRVCPANQAFEVA